MPEEDNANIRLLSAISYLGVLFLIGHIAVEKDNPDVRFHKFQGIVLFCTFALIYAADLLIYLLLSFYTPIQLIVTVPLTAVISIIYLSLTLRGMISAIKVEQKLLPFIGIISVRLREAADSLHDDG